MLRKYVGILWLLFVLSSNTIQKYHRMRVTYILKNFVKNLTSWWQNQSVSFELFIVITDQCYISEAILISVTIEQLWHAWWKFWPYFFHFDSRSEKIFCYLIFCVYIVPDINKRFTLCLGLVNVKRSIREAFKKKTKTFLTNVKIRGGGGGLERVHVKRKNHSLKIIFKQF